MKSVLSIVIPTYGRDAVLVDSIRALLLLALPADELLVIDQTPEHDAETTERLTGWGQAGDIRWLRHAPPGVVGAMNRGLREAQGDIVLFLDDDIIPAEGLVAGHRQAYAEHPEAWAVVGQVLQPEDIGEKAKTLKTETLKKRRKTEDGRQKTEVRNGRAPKLISAFQHFSISAFLFRHFSISAFQRFSFLRRDLGFKFSGTEPAWMENVMAGNLSVRREKALAIGGFDESFIPPVSYRFESDFAKRIVKAGGSIWFEPAARILHLRTSSGGTRSTGNHLTSVSPVHGVGDYYYAMKHGRGLDRFLYVAQRPFREVCTKFHLRHPWWIPVKFVGELRAICLAWKILEKY